MGRGRLRCDSVVEAVVEVFEAGRDGESFLVDPRRNRSKRRRRFHRAQRLMIEQIRPRRANDMRALQLPTGQNGKLQQQFSL